MFTLTINTTITGDGLGINGVVSTQTDACAKRDITLEADSADVEVDLDVDVSAAKGAVLFATADVTIKTNSSSEPDDTINLSANRDLSWITGQGNCPFTVDVTKLYVTCANGGTLKVWVYSDSTPGA